METKENAEMINVSLKDREILRALAARKAQLANCARNDEILKMVCHSDRSWQERRFIMERRYV